MKRIVRLTESDLNRIVRKVLSEDATQTGPTVERFKSLVSKLLTSRPTTEFTERLTKKCYGYPKCLGKGVLKNVENKNPGYFMLTVEFPNGDIKTMNYNLTNKQITLGDGTQKAVVSNDGVWETYLDGIAQRMSVR